VLGDQGLALSPWQIRGQLCPLHFLATGEKHVDTVIHQHSDFQTINGL
jgi:hypothetical protein